MGVVAEAGGAFHDCIYGMASLCKSVYDVQGAAFGLPSGVRESLGWQWAIVHCTWSSVFRVPTTPDLQIKILVFCSPPPKWLCGCSCSIHFQIHCCHAALVGINLLVSKPGISHTSLPASECVQEGEWLVINIICWSIPFEDAVCVLYFVCNCLT